ncbi:sorbosone dehydrogenase family protein [Ensifer sp. HO-A22]|uniref:Sorbosone dehydrogenase family protein n=1 Tax=Ensifer oleiphilus TaxID=2742698 RepID=A0A7Y6UPX5_9HYPH|nr:sorbosone dehydrogenase family protein [Ensifer oleiphilus]NVD41941.1 sorbosone dehydrogenase family protein [Ensifer oleiphilus]
MKSVSLPALFVLLLVTGCETATLTAEQGYGPTPQLVKPNPTLLPTVNIAEASGWAEGQKPTAATGFSVGAFATGLDHPRWIHVLPNGDVLVAETNKPPKKDKSFSLRGWVMGLFMARAGAEVPSANRITLLRDGDGDGVAETRSTFLENLNSPFGMTLSKGTLYVANTDAIMGYLYNEGETRIRVRGQKIADLPAGPINHHWTKDVIASPHGTKLYATIGSNSNVAENGIEAEANRAAVLQIDLATRNVRTFASGLRNPNGLSWQPQSGALWVAVNERDEIGSDLVPDYMTSVKDGGFYGWPYSYFGKHIDTRVKPQRPDLVQNALVPDYALGPHTASLGLTFYTGQLFPKEYRYGAFVGQHGSWNRRPRSGYKVVFVPFANGKPAGRPKDILTGFIGPDDKARGRPVGVAVDRRGGLLVADDVGNAIWRITPSK